MVRVAIFSAAVISLVIKAAGPGLLGDREPPAWSRGIIALLAPALLAGLVVVDVLGPHWSVLSWEMIGGLAVVVVARRFAKAPMLVAVIAGMAATALLRLAG